MHKVDRILVVVMCAVALADCGGTTSGTVRPQTAARRQFTQTKPRKPIPLPSANRRPAISESASGDQFTESKSETTIPLPTAPLLVPQPEPSCEFQATDQNANERQKLDYERQCYRHAEMIVRDRLQLLQDSVEKTISAVMRSGAVLRQQ